MSLVNESFAPKSKQEKHGLKARTVSIGKRLDLSPSRCFPLWAVLQATLPTQASVFSFAQWASSSMPLGALRWQGQVWWCACLLACTLQVVNSGSMSSFASHALAWRLAHGGPGSPGQEEMKSDSSFVNTPLQLARPPSAGVSTDDGRSWAGDAGLEGSWPCQAEGGLETKSHITAIRDGSHPEGGKQRSGIQIALPPGLAFLVFSPNGG